MTGDDLYSLQNLLAIEDDPGLLRIVYPGTSVPVWSLIRVAFLRSIMSDMLFASDGLIGQSNIRSHMPKLKTLASAILHNLHSRTQMSDIDICYISTGFGTFRQDGETRNRLVGYFADCYPDRSLIYQGPGDWTWQGDVRHCAMLSSIPFAARSRLQARVSTDATHRSMASDVIERASRNWTAVGGYLLRTEHMTRLKQSLAGQLAVFHRTVDYYSKWFSRCPIRILIKEDACYGGTSVPVIYAARRVGLTIAEFQHGAISQGHDAYNVAPAIVKSPEFRQTLPDYLLTYGEWWNDQCTTPVRKIAIGNPHFTESIRKLSVKDRLRNDILILGDGIDTRMYLDLCAEIVRTTGRDGRRILFRPHPFERGRVSDSDCPDGVLLDRNADIYQSLREASLVISELSTGLFEAAGLGCAVLLWSTPKSRFAFPQLPFASFSSPAELSPLLSVAGSPRTLPKISPDALWAPEWERNFKNFIEGILST